MDVITVFGLDGRRGFLVWPEGHYLISIIRWQNPGLIDTENHVTVNTSSWFNTDHTYMRV